MALREKREMTSQEDAPGTAEANGVRIPTFVDFPGNSFKVRKLCAASRTGRKSPVLALIRPLLPIPETLGEASMAKKEFKRISRKHKKMYALIGENTP